MASASPKAGDKAPVPSFIRCLITLKKNYIKFCYNYTIKKLGQI